jgi:hypothetical protein
VLHRTYIDEIVVKRMLSVIVNPNRYRSKAAQAFVDKILPQFSTYKPGEEGIDRVIENGIAEPTEPLSL